MADKKQTNITVSPQGGMVRDVMNKLKLIFRLLGDNRVNIFAKLIPVGALIYLVSPIDAISIPIIGALDDAAVLWLASYVFTELAPPHVVAEHVKALAEITDATTSDTDIVDAETTDVTDKPQE